MIRVVEPKDFEQINRWRLLRKAPLLEPGFYPESGVIIDQLAAGWLALTDSRVGLLENFVSNPESDKQERRSAILDIAKCLEEMAKNKGVRYLFAITGKGSIVEACKELKYDFVGESMMFGKEL